MSYCTGGTGGAESVLKVLQSKYTVCGLHINIMPFQFFPQSFALSRFLFNFEFADIVSTIGKTANFYIEFYNIFKTKPGSLFWQVFAFLQNVFP